MRSLLAFHVLLCASAPPPANGYPSGRTEAGQAASTSTSSTFSEEWAETATRAGAPQADVVRSTLRLIYTGGSHGIGSGRYRFELPRRIREALGAEGGSIASLVAYHGALAQGLMVLVASDRRVETLVALLAGGGVTCAAPKRARSLRTSRERLLLIQRASSPPAWLSKLEAQATSRPFEARTCTSPGGLEATLYSPAGVPFTPPIWEIESFEFRLALSIDVRETAGEYRVDVVGIPADEAARRFRLLDSIVHEERTLYIDAGAFVDGSSSVRDGTLSLHRPLGFEMLSRLAPAALAPGETEIVLGAEVFLREARSHGLEYVATNWTSSNPAYDLPKTLLRDVLTPEGVVRIAFLGIVDPDLARWATMLRGEGVTLEEPLPALRRALRSLGAHPNPPDLIVVLTTAPPHIQRTIRDNVRGVDLIIGGTEGKSDRVRRMTFDLRAETDLRRPAIAPLPIHGITKAELTIQRKRDRWALRVLELEPLHTTERMRPDERVRSVVSRTRGEVYPDLDRPLLAAPSTNPILRYSKRKWRAAVCEAVRRYSDADVVLLPELPPPSRIPGPLTELLVVDSLAILDRLELHYVPGSRIVELLRDAKPLVSTACGGQVGVRAPLIRGRPADPETLYRVVTTDRARARGLEGLLKLAYSVRILDLTGPSPITDAEGRPVTLRHAVLTTLRDLRDERHQRDASLEPLVEDSATRKGALWFFRIARASMRLERFRGAEDPAFSGVPETLATSPSSLSIGAEFDASFIGDTPNVLTDLRLRGRFTRLSFDDGADQEPADDLRISSSATLPVVGASLGPLRVMPYGEVLFDTEITPVEQDGVDLPRQEDLFLTLGLSTTAAFLKTLRVGAFYLRDLARTDRPSEFGGRAEADAQIALGRDLKLSTLVDGTLFANTAEDDASDLRFKLLTEARLALPLARYLDVSMFGQLFTFQGRVSETNRVRASYMIGFALDLHGVFRVSL